MELKSFKELLLKKADGNIDLQTLICYIKDDALADEIIESLEKMASSKGDKANSAVTSFAGSAIKPDIDMVHDAISHHLSHFAALNAAHPPSQSMGSITQNYKTHEGPNKISNSHSHDVVDHKLHPAAAEHLERAMHLADFAAKASKHSLGKMSFDHVPPNAWEMNRTSDATRKNANGQTKFIDDQQGLKRRPQAGSKKFPDYGYLLTEPHAGFKHKGKLRGHEGQYPFEEMKINDKHVHIDPSVANEGKFVPHPFDKHPLFEKEGSSPTWEKSEDSRTDEHRNAFADKLKSWHKSPEFNSWLDSQEKQEESDPVAYASKGKDKSKLLTGVKQSNAATRAEVSRPVSSQPTKAAPSSSSKPSPSASPAEAPKVITRKASEKAGPKLQPHEQKLADDYRAGNADAKAFFNQFPQFKKQFGVD